MCRRQLKHGDTQPALSAFFTGLAAPSADAAVARIPACTQHRMQSYRHGCRTPLPGMCTQTAAAVLGVPHGHARALKMTAIMRQAGGRTDRFVSQVGHRRAISPRRLSPAVRQASGGTERSWAADWVSVHTYRVYYGVGQRRPLWVGNAGVLTAFAALRTSVCPRCVPGRDWPSAYSQYPVHSQRVRTTAQPVRPTSSARVLRLSALLAQLLPRARLNRRLLRGRRPQPRLRQRCVPRGYVTYLA